MPKIKGTKNNIVALTTKIKGSQNYGFYSKRSYTVDISATAQIFLGG